MTGKLPVEREAFKSLLGAALMASNELAAVCGVSRVTVWKWLHGRLPIPAYAETIVKQRLALLKLAAISRR